MNKKKFLYLPIESKVRELDAKLLIALEAVEKGFAVVIGDKKMMSKLSSLPTGILFYKDASILMENKFRRAKALGYKIAVHDEEGFVQFNWEDYLNSRIKFSTGKHVDLFFCWGSGQASAINSVKDAYFPATTVVTTGHPRIDLLQPALREYRTVSAQPRKMILINTKLASVNHIRGEQGFMNILVENGMVGTDDAYNFRLKQVEYERELLNAYFGLIDELAKDSALDIVIRPHPSENPDTWKKRFAGHSNISVTNEFPIGYWISKCDCVIHTGCTTAIEAFVMDKPPVAFKPIANQDYDIPLPNEVSIVAKTIPDVITKVHAILNSELNWSVFKSEKLSILSASVLCDPQKLAYKDIVAELDKLDLAFAPVGILQKLKMKGLFSFNSLRMTVSRKVFDENKIIRKSEIKQTIAGLKKVSGLRTDLKVFCLAPHLFLLHK